MSGHTLEEALTMGRGVERPFRCLNPDHEDNNASASVNVVKMVWFCYSCKANGVVDKNRAPTPAELLAMLEPEKACRELPASTLEVYGYGGYWLDRFPDWVCWLQGLGNDPWSGEPVFPVHTPRGRLAGVGRRLVMPGEGSRYKYPWNWSASRSLFGSRGRWQHHEVLALVEGAADQCAVLETGVPAFGCYSAGLHGAQSELVVAMAPKLVLLAYDADKAGYAAMEQSAAALAGKVGEVGFIDWSLLEVKDPAQASPTDRLDMVLKAVGESVYGNVASVQAEAASFVAQAHQLFVEESLSG